MKKKSRINLTRYIFSVSIVFVTVFSSCQQKSNKTVMKDVDILHQNEDELTKVIIYDVFSPPVASRIYVYSSIAAYEAIRFAQPGSESLAVKLRGFNKIPQPEAGKTYNYTLAATKAFFTVVHKMVFSLDSLKGYEAKIDAQYKQELSPEVYARSVSFGESVGKTILTRANADGYIKSRGKARYIGSQEPGKWRPTAPDYSDAVEWCWNTMKTLAIDHDVLEKDLLRPTPYSLDPKSPYFQQLEAEYTLTNHLTSDQKQIAKYWDDNPFVVEHSGHMMFGNKKITPGGHWIGITRIACKKTNASPVKTAKAYAATSIALFDGFISCWNLKYKFSTIRPISVINDHIDKNWQPLLQTPPFPEYPSAHSTITRAAAIVLTKMFGDNFAFEDTSEMKYIGMKRSFSSFVAAANEASISRVYGGIHYQLSVDEGAEEGKKVGNLVVEKLGI
ncbi:MAG: vanadium-dependent haloperoxidase [Bacteroidetes bacterium]|nr:vanadium-dependent haloperoxidase [Bacteroidota bacterium]MBU1372901.1 vanadium-dependent haloperoxidase [Bacteroidota bacterium]MBU1485630.1 vanadium-dependent haloperoxidase [Bacteroidota bacterium]MBU1760534.1 vanadium-dependent haloperoxidase [Bacteroidota bacterium]MBU2268921.1 vanadium-dependent haloperoxidase [Bacteroidota bacterium]